MIALDCVNAVKDYVQAVNSPNGHPFSAGAGVDSTGGPPPS